MKSLGPIRRSPEVEKLSVAGRARGGQVRASVRAFGLVNPVARPKWRRSRGARRDMVPHGKSRNGSRGRYAARALAFASVALLLACCLGTKSHAEEGAECTKDTVILYSPPEFREVDQLIDRCAYDEAIEAAERIDKPNLRLRTYAKVARALAAEGQREKAEAISRRLEHSFERDHVLLATVQGYVEANDDTSIELRLSNLIEDPRDRALAFCYMAAGQLAHNREDDARKIAGFAEIEYSKLTNPYDIFEIIGSISAVYDELGETERLTKFMNDMGLDGMLVVGPSHLIATMASMTMRSQIEDIRRSTSHR